LLARVAEESTGAAVRFAPLERGVTDVMELFDHAAPKQDALREACEWRGGLPACEREPKGEWRFCPYCGKPIRRGGNDV
jgi:rRNA maturation endonuclease Nob1